MSNSRRPGLWAAEEGISAAWFVLLVPLALLILIALHDYVSALLDEKKLASAAATGAQWGRDYGYDPNGIDKAAKNATGLAGVKINTAALCGCAAKGGVAVAECDLRCPEGGAVQPYIVVTALACYGTYIRWPGVEYCSSADSQCVEAGCSRRQILLSSQSMILR